MLVATVLQAVAGLALARAGARFDGALDVHRTLHAQAVALSTSVLDQIAALPVAVGAALAVLWLWGYSPKFITLLLVWGTARTALVLFAPLVIAMPRPAELVGQAQEALLVPSPGIIAGSFALALGFAWFITLLVTGLRSVTAARGWRLAAITVTSLIAAEAASKLFLAAVA